MPNTRCCAGTGHRAAALFTGAAPAWPPCGWGWTASSPVLSRYGECLEIGLPFECLIQLVDLLGSGCRDTRLVYLPGPLL